MSMNLCNACKKLFMAILLIPIPIRSSGQPPSPLGPVPNAKQIEWYHREVTVFLHFNMNTFTGNEWGDGTDKPSQFNPTALDCEQWIRTVKNAGFACAILTVKHHDGFCLWPSEHTGYDIAASPWKNGAGDVVGEFTDACKKYGVKAGLYLSPWDRHESSYGTTAYNTFYANQLKELLTGYGPIHEIWWDGAGDQMAFDFKRWADTIKAIQPDCFIFGAKKASPYVDGRWIGNEDGVAGDPCWSTIDRSVIDEENLTTLPTGQANGTSFVPAECDVSIRPGWYFHAAENSQVKTVATLWNTIYFGSVGRNCVLLLNLPPDTRGRIHAIDSTRLDSLGGWIRGTFAANLAAGATVTALHGRGESFDPSNMIDSSESTYYAASDGYSTDTLLFDLGSPATFDCAMIQERIELGHRITRWSFDAYYNGKWNSVSANKQSIGYKRLLRLDAITATRVRLRITGGKGCPAIHTLGLFRNAFAPTPVVEAAPSLPPAGKRVAPQGVQGVFEISGTMLRLPREFAGRKVRLELYEPTGRTVMRFTAQGALVEMPPEVMCGNRILLVKCNDEGVATSGRVLTTR
ncbi:MAG: alpha-L-fucosidase [Chitinispirillaceae bacterium]|nr:alpha-L-fucosidase [Chitinispirillaceae bacterium]